MRRWEDLDLVERDMARNTEFFDVLGEVEVGLLKLEGPTQDELDKLLVKCKRQRTKQWTVFQKIMDIAEKELRQIAEKNVEKAFYPSGDEIVIYIR